MTVSYIVPHRNRVQLFEKNLESLFAQTNKDFEVVVADNSDVSDWEALKRKAQFFKNAGMAIRLYHVDPRRCQFSHDGSKHGAMYNPAVQQNVAAKKARGDVLVLTSPEVVNARTNVAKITELFTGGQSRFVLGWIGDRAIDVVSRAVPQMMRTGFEIELLKHLCLENRGYGTRCQQPDWKKENYFLGAIKREDFLRTGGIEERFMAGIAFEDNLWSENVEQLGITPEFCDGIAGLHLSHSRAYQGSLVENPNNKTYNELKGQKEANSGRDWGCDSYITETWE